MPTTKQILSIDSLADIDGESTRDVGLVRRVMLFAGDDPADDIQVKSLLDMSAKEYMQYSKPYKLAKRAATVGVNNSDGTIQVGAYVVKVPSTRDLMNLTNDGKMREQIIRLTNVTDFETVSIEDYFGLEDAVNFFYQDALSEETLSE